MPSAYIDAERGDRLRPPRGKPMYHVLVELRDTLGRVLEDLPAGEVVLDLGCGNRPYEALALQTFSRYLGADLPGNPRADVTLGPSGEIPLDDASIDCVLSSQVLEHVREPRRYLAEARRVTRPGGHLVLSTHGVWPYHPDPGDYWRWTCDGLREEVQAAGFTTVRLESVMGRISTALQLLQDALVSKLARIRRRACIALFQGLMGLWQRAGGGFSADAAVYVIVGRA